MGKAEAELNRASSREIKEAIERTRAEMDRTVDALTDQLSPRHMLNDLLARFESSDGGHLQNGAKAAGKWLIRGIGRHPLPSAVIGAGVAWLIADVTGKHGTASEPGCANEDYQQSGVNIMSSESGFEKTTSPGIRDEMASELDLDLESCGFGEPGELAGESQTDSTQRRVAGAAARAKGKASNAAAKARQWSKEKMQRLGRSGERGRQRLSGKSERTKEMVRGRISQVRSGIDRGRDRAEELIDDYPLIVGISAMAVGLIVGLSIPSSRRERRLMGSQASRLRQQADEWIERGKEAAREAAGAMKEEARRQGLTPAGMKESLREVAHEAGQAAEEEGLSAEGLVDKVEAVAEEGAETVREEFRGEDERSI